MRALRFHQFGGLGNLKVKGKTGTALNHVINLRSQSAGAPP
jgi:hypothetical protein